MIPMNNIPCKWRGRAPSLNFAGLQYMQDYAWQDGQLIGFAQAGDETKALILNSDGNVVELFNYGKERLWVTLDASGFCKYAEEEHDAVRAQNVSYLKSIVTDRDRDDDIRSRAEELLRRLGEEIPPRPEPAIPCPSEPRAMPQTKV